MEPVKPGPLPSDEEVNRLLQANEVADLRAERRPPMPVPTDGLFWRLLDLTGPYLALLGLLLTAATVLTAFIGGESFAWVGFAGLAVAICFVLYGVYLWRRGQQQRAAEYLLSRQSQEEARREVARLVLEQSRQSPPDQPAKDNQ